MRRRQPFICALAVLGGTMASGQTILHPADLAKFNATFEQLNGERLKCEVKGMEPWLDFGFRFELAYTVGCEIRQFEGAAGHLNVYLRVQPEDGREILLGDGFEIPAAPKNITEEHLRKVPTLMGFSGVLGAGAGVYDMDLLLVDNRKRVYRHHWKAKAFPRGYENEMKLTMAPNTLAPLTAAPIPEKPAKGGSLTVLLDAAPLNPRSRKLRAWDRAFLLDSLSSLLREMPYTTVRVVAFNLDQQEEIFRQEHFTQANMPRLSATLRALELGTIAYAKLEQPKGWADLLLSLLKDEAESEQPSDTTIILGPMLWRQTEKVPPEMLVAPEAPRSLFCVAYYPREGSDFPDSIQRLTTSLKGKVLRIHSPSELARNLDKLKHEIEISDESTRTVLTRK